MERFKLFEKCFGGGNQPSQVFFISPQLGSPGYTAVLGRTRQAGAGSEAPALVRARISCFKIPSLQTVLGEENFFRSHRDHAFIEEQGTGKDHVHALGSMPGISAISETGIVLICLISFLSHSRSMYFSPVCLRATRASALIVPLEPRTSRPLTKLPR